MHVLMLPSWYPRNDQDLSGSFFREQAQVLADSGHRVGVLAARVISVSDLHRQPLHRGVRWSVEGGVQVGRLDLVQGIPRARTLEAVLACGRWGRVQWAAADYIRHRGRPDVLHAHSLYPGGYLADALSRRWGIPWVLTEHRSLDHLHVLTPWGARREAHVVSHAAVRCGVSTGHAEHLARRFGRTGGRWEVVHNLVPDTPAIPRGLHPVGEPRIGHLSSLAPVKRPDLVVGAFAAMTVRFPGARLAVGGPLGGATGQHVRTLVADSSAHGSVDLVGALAREQVPVFLAGLDALLMPSDSETFGVVMAEALLQGTPVVSTPTWGARDVVGEGDGRIIAAGSGRPAEALAAALVEVLGKDGDPAAAREARRQRCLSRFGPEAFVTRCEQIWVEALR